mmetsp:Transcript_21519/g.56114  ORF Transcript_21519/g.56114 Transcript_21519/m.56114 type:complete len:211 (-) Transcript_21519:53-685(-)
MLTVIAYGWAPRLYTTRRSFLPLTFSARPRVDRCVIHPFLPGGKWGCRTSTTSGVPLLAANHVAEYPVPYAVTVVRLAVPPRWVEGSTAGGTAVTGSSLTADGAAGGTAVTGSSCTADGATAGTAVTGSSLTATAPAGAAVRGAEVRVVWGHGNVTGVPLRTCVSPAASGAAPLSDAAMPVIMLAMTFSSCNWTRTAFGFARQHHTPSAG